MQARADAAAPGATGQRRDIGTQKAYEALKGQLEEYDRFIGAHGSVPEMGVQGDDTLPISP